MIASYYWKEDLLKYAEKFQSVDRPPRWSERLQVNFEKEVIIAFFMIRKLAESTKLSPKRLKYKAKIKRIPCIADEVNAWNYVGIYDLYDHSKEEKIHRDIKFLCNQLIHGGAIAARRGSDRNWDGVYATSDFEREGYLYFIPINEIIKILELAGNDCVRDVTWTYDKKYKKCIAPGW